VYWSMVVQRPLVIQVGLPKMGTTSFANYFRCNGWRVSHQMCANSTRGHCTHCLFQFVEAASWKRPQPQSNLGFGGPMQSTVALHSPSSATFRDMCGAYDVFAQLDSITATACIFPQVSFLPTLVNALPDACFVLNTRPLNDWIRSIRRYTRTKGSFFGMDLMDRMLGNCPIWPRNESGLMAWAQQHVLAARHDLQTARCKLEIDLAAPPAQTRELLNQTFPGTKASCWGVANAARQASDAVAPGKVGSPVRGQGFNASVAELG